MKGLISILVFIIATATHAGNISSLEDLTNDKSISNSEKAYLIGLYYDFGYGVKQDFKRAAKQYKKSDHPHSFTMEAMLYNNGQGQKLDFRRANALYKQNPQQEQHELYLEVLEKSSVRNVKAAMVLGSELLFSDTPSCKKGLSLVHRALKQDYVPAMYTMAGAYSDGVDSCIEKNTEKSEKYYLMAAEEGFPQAMNNLYVLYQDKGTNEMNEKAHYWLEKAAHLGVMEAQVQYGFKYYNGEWVEQNKELAYKWWLDASNQKHDYAMFLVGFMLTNGDGVDTDLKGGMNYLLSASEKNICQAQYEISYILSNRKTKFEESRRYFDKAIKNGCKDWRELESRFIQ